MTFSGDLLRMTHVGDLDVDFVEDAKISCLVVPDNIDSAFIRSGKRHGHTCYYGAEDMWEAIR